MKKFGKGCLVVVGIILVLGIVGALLGRGGQPSSSPASSGTQPSAAASQPEAQPAAASATDAPSAATEAPKAAGVGEDVQVDEVRWKILEATDLGKTLKAKNQFTKDKTTSGRFVQVRFELENLSKDMLSFAGLDLLDAQERTFKASSDAFQFIPTEEACVLENLNPNVAKSCTAIYEVPANAAGLKAQVTDLKIIGSDSSLVDLGLKAE
ncbi:hypothetical protein SE17_09855 [Kouleothrix aurantiaca]|uniref:DUF4352 domain-containing protein n=1 Tax=Kouleothrix aurantiaca TaxID=186479 RepID=A0A0P9F9R7_9CHLR|nr:hypothetical protein SE17_09855 [Kouleothrix aurantiaca]